MLLVCVAAAMLYVPSMCSQSSPAMAYTCVLSLNSAYAVLCFRGRAFYVPDEPRKGADGTETGYHCNPSYCALNRDQIDDWKRTGLRGGLGNVRSAS